jgi:L,D-transpeptidase catalytic domain
VCSCRDDGIDEATRRRLEQDSVFMAKRNAERWCDTLADRKVRAANAAVPRVTYKRMLINSHARLDSIRETFAKTPERMLYYRVLTTVNRKDIRYFRLGDTIMMPDVFSSDMRMYSFFPQLYPQADTIPKIILISNKYQCYACYEHGKLVRFAACNTGEERKPTFPGRYTLNWRDKLRRSSLDSSWVLPYTWNFHLFAGSAFHQFAMPGRPASHSCVRQFMADAEWLFHWGTGGKIDSVTHKHIPMTGAPVIILDVFDFARRRGGPWWDVASNRDSLIVLPRSPLAVEEALIPISQIPADVRWNLPNKERYLYAEDTLRARGLLRAEAELLGSINYNKQRRDLVRFMAKQAAKEAALKNTDRDTGRIKGIVPLQTTATEEREQ